MINYKFYKWKPFEIKSYKVKVEKPYEYLSMIFEGSETSKYIQTLIDGIQNVIDGNPEASFSIENQAGFIGYAFAADSSEKEYPEGGFQVFDFFTLNKDGDSQMMFTIPLFDILKLLQEFKEFLQEHKK